MQGTFLGTFRSILSLKIFQAKKPEGVSLGVLAKLGPKKLFLDMVYFKARDGYQCYK